MFHIPFGDGLSQIIQEAIDEANLQNDTSFAIHSNIDEPLIIQGNRSLVSSIFSNLINNAMSYSGGKNIYINLESFDNNNYNFTVEDDGIGIEEIHLSRIFERFYRIDKGRSRKLGGTGLGLSIVKHAVIFHGGIITATNRPQGGLKFTFSLQKQT